MDKMKFKLTLDEFFDLYYINNTRLAISCEKPFANQFLSFALYEMGKKVNDCITIDDWNMDPLHFFMGSYYLLNNPVYGSDLIRKDRAKELNIKVIDFYEIDCTKYLKDDAYFRPWRLEEYKNEMLNASKEMFEERQKSSQKSEENDNDLVK